MNMIKLKLVLVFALSFTFCFCLVANADLAQDAGEATKGGANTLEKLKQRATEDGALKPEHDTEQSEFVSDDELFPEDAESENTEELDAFLIRPIYTPKGKRDPFKPFIQAPKETKKTTVSESTPPIKRFDLNQYRIVGVIKFGGEPRAMVVDPEKNTYYLGVGDEIGNKNGEIIEVRDNGLLVQEKRYYEDIFGNSKVEVEKSVLAFVEEEG